MRSLSRRTAPARPRAAPSRARSVSVEAVRAQTSRPSAGRPANAAGSRNASGPAAKSMPLLRRGQDAVRVEAVVLLEGGVQLVAAPLQRLHAEGAREEAEPRRVEEPCERRRGRAVPVRRGRRLRLERRGVRRGGDPLVERHPEALVRDPRRRESERQTELQGDVAGLGNRLALHLGHRLLEEPHVRLEADRLDVPRLLRAEDRAGAADLEVLRRDPEAGAEVGELLQDAEAAPRVVGERRPRRHHEPAGGRLVAPADAAAELVELGEAVAVGPVDQHRVRRRDVEPVLDDRRGEEEVGRPGDERAHRALQLPLRHLPVARDDLHAPAPAPRASRARRRARRSGCGRSRPARPSRSRPGWPP